MTQSYARTFGTQYIIIRPFNNYGPRKRALAKADIIPTAIRRLSSGQPATIFGDGMQARDYVFVEDTARAVQLALVSKQSLGETIHIATGVSRTILSIVTDLATLMGVKPVFHFEQGRQGDVAFLCGDGRKASSLLNFIPATPWHWGLERCIEYYSPGS
jgi:UDP-glucose 4-epimerase